MGFRCKVQSIIRASSFSTPSLGARPRCRLQSPGKRCSLAHDRALKRNDKSFAFMTRARAVTLMSGLAPSLLRVVREIQQRGFPERILFHGVAPGDNLLLAAVCRELRKRGARKLWILSPFPGFFSKSDVVTVLPLDEVAIKFLWRTRLIVRPERIDYGYPECGDYKLQRTMPLERHIIAEMCARAGVEGEVDLRTNLELTDSQKRDGSIASNQIAIQSSALAAAYHMDNKQWFVERFQQVSRTLCRNFAVIQLGSKNDPLLDGAHDLRGETSPIQAAGIISASKLFIGLEGFLAHLARAVNTRSVIIYGGRTPPQHSGYICNVNLFTQMSCSPCWNWSRCDFDRACMKHITVESVLQGCYRQLEKLGAPLELATTWVQPRT